MASRSGPAPTRLRLTAILFTLAVVLSVAPADAAATWTRVASPNRGTVASALQDVVMIPGTTTTWAVGYSALASGVSANSAGNLWAVGYTAPPSAGNATLILKGTGG